MIDLFLKNQAAMYQTAYRIVGEAQIAEDMVQETCISLINHLEEVKKVAANKLRTYVTSATRNTSINYVVKRNRRSRYSFLTDDDRVFESRADDAEIDSALIREADIETIKRALRALSEKDQLLLNLKYYDGKTDAEIARVLEIKADSVRSYLTRARRHLMEKIDEEK